MAKNSGEQGVLGTKLAVVGRVRGEGDLLIEGRVEGDVSVAGQLQLGSGGTVSGSVEAQSLHVAGELHGNVQAEGSVHIVAGGSLRGDVVASDLSLDEGGQFSGRLDADFDLPEAIA